MKTNARSKGGLFGLRNVVSYMRDPLTFLMRAKESGGDIAEMKILGNSWILLSHPDHIEGAMVTNHKRTGRDEYVVMLERALGKGLLTSDGELWKRQRKLMSFAFTPKRIRGYADAMVDVTERGIREWRDGMTIHMYPELSRITMEVVAEVLFGTGVTSREVETVREAMEVIGTYLANSPEAVLKLPAWFPTPRNYAVNRGIGEIDSIVYRFIEQRRSSTHDDRDDLLHALLAATDDDGLGMSDAQLRDEVVTLFLAGHETTALALGHTFYLLSRYPDVQRRLHREVDGVLDGRTPKRADLEHMPYLEKVLKESMRLYPPAWVTGREVTEPFELGGRRLEKRTQIMLSQWVVHRDPRWWPNPEAFDPERWTQEKTKERPRFAYFPFGGGPRVCIGNHFAMMEAKLMIALIASRFQLDLLPGERLELVPSVTLRAMGKGVRVKLKERRRASANATATPRAIA